jgi:hypothetical protein
MLTYGIFAGEVSWSPLLRCMAMRNRMLTSVVCLGIAFLACGGAGSNGESILGVWRVAERSYSRPDSSWTNSDPEPGLYIFGERYFSVQEIRESGPRVLFGESTTELERLAAFDVFHAHSGTYEITDSTLTIVPTLAKSPNSMDGSTYSYALELSGDRLTITRVSGDGETRVTILTRVE